MSGRAGAGEGVQIPDQMTETYQGRGQTEPVVVMTGVRNDVVDTTHNEAKANKLDVEGRGPLDLDLETITSADGLLCEVIHISTQYARRCDLEEIACRAGWHADAAVGS